ncbi:MAG TPA: hypothetical protein VM367_12520 [Pseudonocardia sp.]|jgi:hypothetical protein|nr:hypothetical protein [Pseudonocardia sp.]
MIELACDESGYEGEHLIGGVTDVFAHASVHIEQAAAARCVAELRERIRSPATEYKANHLLRAKHRNALEWLLAPDGPLAGAAAVHLVDKTYFAAVRLVELLAGWPASAARTVHREALLELGPRWTAVLAAFDALMRVRRADELAAAAAQFSGVATSTAGAAPGRVGELLGEVARAAPHGVRLRRRFLDDPSRVPPLDPLVPAIRATVALWSGPSGQAVRILHDRQTALRADRMARIGGRLAGLRFVESRADARVQLADFLAGVAIRIASQALAGRSDEPLVAALIPFTDVHSTWAHEGSGTALGIA